MSTRDVGVVLAHGAISPLIEPVFAAASAPNATAEQQALLAAA
jgi:hypothetical protein